MNNVTLKEHFDLRFDEWEKRTEDHNKQVADALEKAEKTLEIRLAGMNEFREQINAERVDYVRRQELRLMLKPIEDKLAFAQGNKAGKEWVIGIGLAVIFSLFSLIVSIVNVLT